VAEPNPGGVLGVEEQQHKVGGMPCLGVVLACEVVGAGH
jgi:hypothetical protein